MKRESLAVLIGLIAFPWAMHAQDADFLLNEGYQLETFTHKDLLSWESHGIGGAVNSQKQVLLYETPGSEGYMIVSPKSYGDDVVVSYEVMALNASTVLVAQLGVHNTGDYEFNPETGYDGNVHYLMDSVNSYMFVFHNASFNKFGPFVRKYPEPGKEPLRAATENVLETGKYSHVEIGVVGGRIHFKVDGKTIWQVTDPDPYKGGKIAFRVRGKISQTGSCVIRNVKIYSRD